MEISNFTPSQVALGGMFIGTFDHSEAENTAAIIVKVLSMNGDTWRPATCEELSTGFDQLTKVPGPWRDWFNNPFNRIDMHDLVDRGFAIWEGPRAIQFTAKGLQRMEKWVQASEDAP